MMSASILPWWSLLCAVAVLNVLAWTLSALALKRRQTTLSVEAYATRRLQLVLSAGYVFGCAFRSAFPVYDVPRLCLFDSWLASVMVGRSVATIAELCFVGQWAVMLREISRLTGSTIAKTASRTVVPSIAIAEMCSWYSVLTTSNLGHVFEESIWTLCVALLVISLTAIWPRSSAPRRRVLAIWGIASLAYIAYMVLVDVPRYWSRWLADEASGRHYLSIAQGFLDVSQHWVVSHRWQDWQSEVGWMSLYFSVAVWLSISLIHTAAPERLVDEEHQRLPTTIAYRIRTITERWH